MSAVFGRPVSVESRPLSVVSRTLTTDWLRIACGESVPATPSGNRSIPRRAVSPGLGWSTKILPLAVIGIDSA